MKEEIMRIIVFAAPLVAGFITSVLIPIITKKIVVNYLKKKIDEVNEPKQIKDVKCELNEIKREILEMRGKRKWKNTLYGFW